MGGLLLGGILWGILGDKRGRLSVLFGSIITYSIANIACGFVKHVTFMDPVTYYALMRFVAGVGLAGELGAGNYARQRNSTERKTCYRHLTCGWRWCFGSRSRLFYG
jgi:MFS family permease